MTKITKNLSIMCFPAELCQGFNTLMMMPGDLVGGVGPACPAKYYKEVVVQTGENLTF